MYSAFEYIDTNNNINIIIFNCDADILYNYIISKINECINTNNIYMYFHGNIIDTRYYVFEGIMAEYPDVYEL